MFGCSSLLNWMDFSAGSCRFFICVYLWFFIQCHSRIARHVVYSLHLFIISVAVPFRRLVVSVFLYLSLSLCLTLCVCETVRCACIDSSLGAATYIPRAHCMLPNNWHDYFFLNCSKANIDSKPITVTIDLLIWKKSHILFTQRNACLISDWRNSHMNKITKYLMQNWISSKKWHASIHSIIFQNNRTTLSMRRIIV